MTTTFKTKEITTLKSVSSKILQNKITREWIQVRWTEKYKDGVIELWVYSGSLLQNGEVFGFDSLKELKEKWAIVIE
tara:strand:- start:1989 stop:2219 length:231 start_codon:yes stop_codon:yes gene_type:complete